MKKLLIAVLLIITLPLLYAEVVDKIIARVGNDIILLSDLAKQINQMKSAKVFEEGTSELEILSQMIESRLIIQKAKELNLSVEDKKIKVAAENRIKQIRAMFSSEEEYQREIRKMKLTSSDLLKYFTDLYTEQALTQEFYKKFIAVKIKDTEKEKRDFYIIHKDSLAIKPVTWNIGMILRETEVSPETNNAQLKAIKSVQDKLKSGESFSTLAKKESQCPSSAQGGDLGFISKGKMVKPFEDAAFTLKVGEVSDVVKTQYGYHLIKMEEERNDEIRVSHILKLLVPSAADTLAARARMEDIRGQFLKNKNFAELAKTWSMDKDSAKDGGSIGEYGGKDFPELFASYLTALKVGDITEVLENHGMFYLFTKSGEIPSRMLSYEEVSKQLFEIISRQKQVKVYEDWIDQLKKENFVEILL